MQLPLLQTLLPGQTVPQAPQWNLLFIKLTHVPEQRVVPGAQTQVPALHTSLPAGQARLHAPQWFWLELVSTQLPLQSVCPPGQLHWPLTHTCSSRGHVLKQAPQWLRSLALSTQAPLHSSGRPLCGSHTQPFAVQTRPVPLGHTLPQPRQLLGSVKLTQPPLQRI